jgi:MinD superfamily P-loop ATPase
MNIGILSGKGGTGKTTVSTNLSIVMGANYIDCDVEEPNGFIFLNPENIKSREVKVDYPYIDDSKCKLCRECIKACQFNALAEVKNDIILFQKICHSCGACKIACRFNALSYKKRAIGIIEEGRLNDNICKRGLLNIGEPSAVPVIRELLNDIGKELNILDCAPGTSCNVISALKYVDGVVLVTEPTEFGLHDLNMAVQLARMFKLTFGVIINKSLPEDNRIQKYCEKECIPVLGDIPYSRDAAQKYSEGKMLIEIKEYNKIFNEIAQNVKKVLPWN